MGRVRGRWREELQTDVCLGVSVMEEGEEIMDNTPMEDDGN